MIPLCLLLCSNFFLNLALLAAHRPKMWKGRADIVSESRSREESLNPVYRPDASAMIQQIKVTVSEGRRPVLRSTRSYIRKTGRRRISALLAPLVLGYILAVL